MASYTTNPSEILEYAKKPLVFGSGCSDSLSSATIVNKAFYMDATSSTMSCVFYDWRTFEKFTLTDRIVGYIIDEYSDGSYKVALLGDNVLLDSRNCEVFSSRKTVQMSGSVSETDGVYKTNVPLTPVYGEAQSMPNGYVGLYSYGENAVYPDGSSVDLPTDFLFTWKESPNTAFGNRYNFGSIGNTLGRQNGNIVISNTLTRDLDSTLVMGVPYENDNWYSMPDLLEPAQLLQGDILDWLYSEYALMYGWTGYALPLTPPISLIMSPVDLYRTNCRGLRYYNLILTKNYNAAIRYLDDGTLPSDAKLLPLDADNMPGYNPDDGADEPGEDGGENDDIEDTPNVPPAFTTQRITNNNLYWLQAGQLESFITWFWEDAGEVLELEDLFEKLQGLYNNLGDAIINIRYMPVDISWCGGATAVNSIIVGMIECPQSAMKVNKATPGIRSLGSVKIPQKYGGKWSDYAPYTDVMLYLPYHGFLDLDANLVSGREVSIEAIYDIMSGTVQYTIFCTRNGSRFLINSILAKMAVDIPITLQSKADRDSALFSNVSNAVGAMVSAAASAATSNPVGLVMSTAAVAQSGTQSPPMNLKGTVGENGAFYVSPYPAIYVKRAVYNRPARYAESVGYPCNKGYQLKSSEISGYFTVYNPHIDFNEDVKPLQSEVEEIYSLLEGGVYK